MNSITEILDQLMSVHPLLAGLAGFLVGVFPLIWRFRGHHPKQCASALAELENQLSDANQQVDESRNRQADLNTELAVARSQLNYLEMLEKRVNEANQNIDHLNSQLKTEATERAKAEQLCTQIPVLEGRLKAKQQEINENIQDINRLNASNTELRTRTEEETRNSAEKLKLLQDAEQKLSHQFENLANKILDEKSKKFTEQNNINLSNLVNPLREQLGDFRKKVDDVYVNDSKDRALLRNEIKNLRIRTEKISEDAVNLTQALKGDNKVQGNWGELILEKVLEQSGLRKGIEYETQSGFRDSDNNLLKPDVIVHLPEGKDVVIDSKVSLLAYEAHCSAQDENTRNQALKQHISSIQKHIKDLSEKDYSALKGLRSLDFVLMFLPIEAAFLTACQSDDRLYTTAFKHKIVVVSPTTLLATLRIIENIWRYERQNENANLIAEKAGLIYDKLRGLVEDIEKLGTQIGVVQKTYDGVINKLTQGQGNLIRQAKSFIDLGVKVKKKLPKSITEQAESEDESLSLRVIPNKTSKP